MAPSLKLHRVLFRGVGNLAGTGEKTVAVTKYTKPEAFKLEVASRYGHTSFAGFSVYVAEPVIAETPAPTGVPSSLEQEGWRPGPAISVEDLVCFVQDCISTPAAADGNSIEDSSIYLVDGPIVPEGAPGPSKVTSSIDEGTHAIVRANSSVKPKGKRKLTSPTEDEEEREAKRGKGRSETLPWHEDTMDMLMLHMPRYVYA